MHRNRTARETISRDGTGRSGRGSNSDQEWLIFCKQGVGTSVLIVARCIAATRAAGTDYEFTIVIINHWELLSTRTEFPGSHSILGQQSLFQQPTASMLHDDELCGQLPKIYIQLEHRYSA